MTGKDISHIEIRKAGDEEFYFVFRLPCDGMFVSIFFENMSESVAAVENIKRCSTREARYIRNTTLAKQLYFIFTAKDKEPIGQSTRYKYASSMDAGLKYMKKHLSSAEVVDLTT